MECRESLELISAEMDGEIDAPGRRALEDHLALCASCREAREALRKQDGELRRAFEPRREAARGVGERVIEGMGKEKAVRWGMPWLPMVLSAAAGFLLAVVLMRGGGEKEIGNGTGIGNGNGEETTAKVAVEGEVTLAHALGALEMLRPGRADWEPVPTGGSIRAGSRVRTAARALCELRTPDGSEVRLNGDTEVLFHSPRRLELARGQVFSSVEEAAEPYQVRVPRADAAVTALGTKFDVSCRSSEAQLIVVQGSTQVEGPAGEAVVRSGERARIARGRIQEKSSVHDLVLATSWVHEVLKLKGRDNEELARRASNLFALIGEGKMQHLTEKEILALGDHCVRPLAEFIASPLSEKDPRRQAEAARILQKIAVGWSIPLLIERLTHPNPEVRFWMARGLERLTDGVSQEVAPEGWRTLPGEAREAGAGRWREWWEKNRDRYPEG